jgi:bifunctional ADP-heptose synthase (sugar kinase/adenylyltransferase)
MAKSSQKTLTFLELLDTVETLKKEGKKIVQTHGVFDLIHPGIIQHLNSARELGDILIATVIKDEDIRRGPGRPVFPETLRLQNVASLDQIDYTCLVEDKKTFDCVQRIQPDVFVKGQAQKDRDQEISQKIFQEEKDLLWGKTEIMETDGFSFSSTEIINRFLEIYSEDTKKFLQQFFQKYSFKEIADLFHGLEKLKVCLVGDGIIDEYHYCEPMGKAAKANLVVNRYVEDEVFAGGSFAIANHVAGICKDVHLVTLLGKENPRDKYIQDNLKPNVNAKFFYRPDGPTVTKTRFVHQYLNQKLFEVNYLNDTPVSSDLEQDIIEYLESCLADYDLVLLSDFGHGFITQNIYETLRSKSKILAVNTQTNAANSGYNLITKYHHANLVCLDETEVRLAAHDKTSATDQIARRIKDQIKADHLIVTLGKQGAIGINRKNEISRTPIFSTKVVDTIGAGDAFFAFTAPCVAQDMPMDMVSFVGNAVGALAVQIVCNKRPVEKHELLEFIHSLTKSR